MRIIRITLYGVFLFWIYSCQNEEGPSNEKSKKNLELSFFSNKQVQDLIKQHECFFLSSYWVGMSMEESIEITRYLIDKVILTGIVLNSDGTKVFSMNRFTYQETLNIDTFRMTEWTVRLKTPNYNLNAKTYFKFDDNQKLENVNQYIENANFQSYEELISLFRKKYGAGHVPFYKDSYAKQLQISNGYSVYIFTKNNQQIKVEYIPEGSYHYKIKQNKIDITYDDMSVVLKMNKSLNEQMKKGELLKKKQIEERNKDVLNTVEKI
jgi:hypothetical protein